LLAIHGFSWSTVAACAQKNLSTPIQAIRDELPTGPEIVAGLHAWMVDLIQAGRWNGNKGPSRLSCDPSAFNWMWAGVPASVVLGSVITTKPVQVIHTTFVEISACSEGPIQIGYAACHESLHLRASHVCCARSIGARVGQMAGQLRVLPPRAAGLSPFGAGHEDAQKPLTPAMAFKRLDDFRHAYAEVDPDAYKPAPCRLPHN